MGKAESHIAFTQIKTTIEGYFEKTTLDGLNKAFDGLIDLIADNAYPFTASLNEQDKTMLIEFINIYKEMAKIYQRLNPSFDITDYSMITEKYKKSLEETNPDDRLPVVLLSDDDLNVFPEVAEFKASYAAIVKLIETNFRDEIKTEIPEGLAVKKGIFDHNLSKLYGEIFNELTKLRAAAEQGRNSRVIEEKQAILKSQKPSEDKPKEKLLAKPRKVKPNIVKSTQPDVPPPISQEVKKTGFWSWVSKIAGAVVDFFGSIFGCARPDKYTEPKEEKPQEQPSIVSRAPSSPPAYSAPPVVHRVRVAGEPRVWGKSGKSPALFPEAISAPGLKVDSYHPTGSYNSI